MINHSLVYAIDKSNIYLVDVLRNDLKTKYCNFTAMITLHYRRDHFNDPV